MFSCYVCLRERFQVHNLSAFGKFVGNTIKCFFQLIRVAKHTGKKLMLTGSFVDSLQPLIPLLTLRLDPEVKPEYETTGKCCFSKKIK
jgi:hypothetical protein